MPTLPTHKPSRIVKAVNPKKISTTRLPKSSAKQIKNSKVTVLQQPQLSKVLSMVQYTPSYVEKFNKPQHKTHAQKLVKQSKPNILRPIAEFQSGHQNITIMSLQDR